MSVKNQSFADYELIVVCDACEDKTAEAAREYADMVIEVDYGAPGYARNAGLDVAKGEWIIFLDSDDWFLHEYVFEILDREVGREGEDVLFVSFVWKHVGYTKQTEGHYYNAVWSKIWRHSSIKDIRFDGATVGEDGRFTEDVMNMGTEVRFADIPVVYYNYMRHGSIMWKEYEYGKL